MTHRLNLLLLILAAMVGLPFWWLLLSNPARDMVPHPLSMAQLRELADEMPGPRPTGVEMVMPGWKRIPGNAYSAGSGMKPQRFGVLTFRLVVPGTGGIVIDGGATPQLGRPMGLDRVVEADQARVERWMRGADMILATSERPLHLGGLADFAGKRDAAMALARTRLNRWQVPEETADDHISWPRTLVLRPAITAGGPVAVAPGVVVIPTGAPTPGSQMIYARLTNGREYMLAGDVAPFAVNFTELRVRSNLLDRDAPAGQRSAIMRWLVTLRALKHEAQGMVVVPGHDFDWLNDPVPKSGVQLAKP